MSITTVSFGVSAAGVRPLVAPRKVSRASSSPEIVRASMPKRSFSSSRKAGPLEASRMALVATAIVSRHVLAIHDLAVPGERGADAVHRLVRQLAGGVHTLAQARDRGLLVELGERAVRDVRHEQAGGVRAEIDYSDAHGRGP